MADSLFKVGTFTKATAGAPVDQAITGIGFTPKALILFCEQGTAEDTNSAGAAFCFGFSDGTTEKSIWTGSKDAVATSDANRYANDSKIINIRNESSGAALLAEADLKTFDADGFTLTWTTNNATAYIIKYIAIGGDDITADVFEFTQKTSTGSQSVATALNTADFVLLASIGSAIKNTLATSMLASIGMASGPSNEGAMCIFAGDALGTSATHRFQRTDRVHLVGTEDSPQTTQAQAEFTNFTATGFDLNYLNADASARVIFGLTIKGGTWEVGNDVTKASTGTQAYTTIVKPVGLFQFNIGTTASTSVLTQSKLDFGASSGASDSHGGTLTDEDAIGTTDSYRRSSATYLMNLLNQADGSVLDRASLDSFNALDFTLNFNDADATQRQFVWVVLKEVLAAGGGPTGDTIWCGTAAGKLYKMAGFTSTLTDSIAIATIDTFTTGISWDGTDTIWCGAFADKLYKQSAFTSTLIDSIAIGTIDTFPTGISWDGTDTIWCGGFSGKLYKMAGFTSTLTDSIAIGAIDLSIGISWDGTDTMWSGNQAYKLYKMAGFTSTLTDSIAIGAIDTELTGISWDGRDTLWCGASADKLYKQSAFTSTLIDSIAIGAIDILIQDIEHGDLNERLGLPASVTGLCPRNHNRKKAFRRCRGGY